MTNLEALEYLAGFNKLNATEQAAYAQLRRALEALEAVEVLDGWLMSNERRDICQRRHTDRIRYEVALGFERIGSIQFHSGADPHAARIAAAAAVKGEG